MTDDEESCVMRYFIISSYHSQNIVRNIKLRVNWICSTHGEITYPITVVLKDRVVGCELDQYSSEWRRGSCDLDNGPPT